MLLDAGKVRLAALAAGEAVPNFGAGATLLVGDATTAKVKTQTSLQAVRSRAAWTATTVTALGVFRRPTAVTDASLIVYEATIAGTTAAAEPVWPTVDGATIADGTVTWTARQRITSVALDPGYPTRVNNVLTYRGTAPPGAANYAWEEWGVLGAAGIVLLNREVTPIRNAGATKTATEAWQFTVTVPIENP